MVCNQTKENTGLVGDGLTRIWNKGLVIVVGQIAEWSIAGEGADAFLRQHAHVDLQAQQGENGQWEQRQDDDVAQVLHRFDHSSHDSLQAWSRDFFFVII